MFLIVLNNYISKDNRPRVHQWKNEKKSLFSPYCGDETTIFHDRALGCVVIYM